MAVHLAPLGCQALGLDTLGSDAKCENRLITDALAPPALTAYILAQLDLAGLPHPTFTDDALGLILRISEGTLRAVKNLCVGALIEAVRDQTKTVGIKQVNAVLMQPHLRHNTRDEPAQPLVANNQKNKPK